MPVEEVAAAPGGIVPVKGASVVVAEPDTKSPRLTGAGGRPRAVQFPWKLHMLLEHCHEHGLDDVMAWDSDGKFFQVHNKTRFEQEIMPKFFDTNRFKSFQRSLNLWGFYIKNRGGSVAGPDSAFPGARTMPTQDQGGECWHPHFLRGKPELCHKMQRIRKKTNKTRMPNKPKAAIDAKKTELNGFQQRQKTLEERSALLMAIKNNIATMSMTGGATMLPPPSRASPFASPSLTSMSASSPMMSSSSSAAQCERHRLMLQALMPQPPSSPMAAASSVFSTRAASSLFPSSSNATALLSHHPHHPHHHKRVLLEAAMDKAMQMTSIEEQEQRRLRAVLQGREESHARMLLDLATGSSSGGGMASSFPATSESLTASCLNRRLLPSSLQRMGLTNNSLTSSQRNSHSSLAAALLSSSSHGTASTAAAFFDALSSSSSSTGGGGGRYY